VLDAVDRPAHQHRLAPGATHLGHPLPHLPRPEPRIAEAVDQGRDQVASIGGLAMRQQGALQDEPHVEALDALCGPIRRELFGADPPHLLRVRLEKDVVEAKAKLISGPVLEAAWILDRRHPRLRVARHASDRLQRPQVPERVGCLERIREIASSVVDTRKAVPRQHLRAEDLGPEVFDLLVLGEEPVASDVEPVALVLDRASQPAHVGRVFFDHRGRDVVLHQLIGRGQPGRAGADDHNVLVAVPGTQVAHSINRPDAGPAL